MTVREAEQARDEAIADQTAAQPLALERGLKVIDRWARTGKPFSSNDYRDELALLEVPSKLGGSLIQSAIGRGLIRRIPGAGVVSTDTGTHGKRIAEYIGAHIAVPPAPSRSELVAVPVQRDHAGKFASKRQPGPGAESMFGDL